jgi:hypothetical protein
MSRRNISKSDLQTQLEDALICGTTFFNKDTEQERATRLRLHKIVCKKCQGLSKSKYFEPVQKQDIAVNLTGRGKQNNQGNIGKRFMARNFGISATTKIEPISSPKDL